MSDVIIKGIVTQEFKDAFVVDLFHPDGSFDWDDDFDPLILKIEGVKPGDIVYLKKIDGIYHLISIEPC